MTVVAPAAGPSLAGPRVDAAGFAAAAAAVRRGAADCDESAERLRRLGVALGTAGWSGVAARAAVDRATVLGSAAARFATAVGDLAAALTVAVADLEVATTTVRPAADEAAQAAEVRLARAVAAFLAAAVPPAGLRGRPGPSGLSAAGALQPGLPTLPASTAPAVVAAWWDGLSASERIDLVQRCPHRLGGLDGLPVAVRDRANRSVLAARRRELRASLAAAEGVRRPPGVADYAWRQGGPTAAAGRAAELRRRSRVLDAVHRAIAQPGRYLLDLDPTGSGRAVVAVGDPDAARHVAVLVPGMGTTVAADLERHTAAAERLRAAARGQPLGADRAAAGGADPGATTRPGAVHARTGPAPAGAVPAAPIRGGTVVPSSAGPAPAGVAVVAWLGYRAPDVASVLSTDRAHAAVPELRATLAALDARAAHVHGRPQHVTLVGHSYGSLVSGLSLRHAVPVDDLVLLGSPGVGAEDRTELHVRGSGGVYVVEAPDDLVADSGWFGSDPSRRAFGADALPRALPGGPSLVEPRGHSQYLDAGTTSLNGVAAVVAGGGPR